MAGGKKRLGKFLNWMLVPMYTRVLATESDFGIVTNLYAWTALLMVILTYGMETGFFRFMNKKEIKLPMRVYATTLFSLAFTSVLFMVFVFSALTPVSNFLGYGAHPEYIGGGCLLLYSVCFPPVSGEGGSLCGDQAAEYIPEYRIGNILPDRLPVAV